MNFKVAERKTKSTEESFIKSYLKPIALKFNDQYENVKQCKTAYKKHYKQIGIPADLQGEWFIDGDSNVLQLATLYEKPDPLKTVEFELCHGISVLYLFQRFPIKDQDEIGKLQKKFDDLSL